MFGGCFCWNVWARGVRRYSLQACGDKHYLFTAGSAYRMWARSSNSVRTAALGQRKLTSVGEDAVSPSSWLKPCPHPRRSCRLCRSSASRRPPPPLLWRSLCWNSWGRSSCSSRTPPNSTSGSRASSGLLWWGELCVGKHFKGERAKLYSHVLSQDFLRCVTASIIYFIVSIMAVSRYVDGSSKAAGVNLSSWFPSRPLRFCAALTPALLLFADIWFHRHHRVRFRLLSHFQRAGHFPEGRRTNWGGAITTAR